MANARRNARLVVSRDQVLAFRRTTNGLDARAPQSTEALRAAAWAGLQDSMPRAAVLSLHARLDSVEPNAWADAAFEQVWGPRYSVFVVPREDRAVFTLGRLPEGAREQARARNTADALATFLAGRAVPFGEAGRGLGVPHNSLRYAAPTGRVLIRWDGARQPTIRMVPAPHVDPADARLELARRYLHVYGPTTIDAFARWAGVRAPAARTAFGALSAECAPVRTPIGDAWILAADEPLLRSASAAAAAPSGPVSTVRFLPSGDAFFLLGGPDRELLVPDGRRRGELWTSRVWPGALLVDGDIAGTWRRAGPDVSIDAWRALSAREREAVEAEAASLPLPDIAGRVRVRIDQP